MSNITVTVEPMPENFEVLATIIIEGQSESNVADAAKKACEALVSQAGMVAGCTGVYSLKFDPVWNPYWKYYTVLAYGTAARHHGI